MATVPVHCSNAFTWTPTADGRGWIGASEASALSCFGYNVYVARLFDDAADLGFKVRSHKTGRIMTFGYAKTEFDAHLDREVVYHEFHSVEKFFHVNGTKVRAPQITLRIYND
jgi:hypothetical protein